MILPSFVGNLPHKFYLYLISYQFHALVNLCHLFDIVAKICKGRFFSKSVQAWLITKVRRDYRSRRVVRHFFIIFWWRFFVIVIFIFQLTNDFLSSLLNSNGFMTKNISSRHFSKKWCFFYYVFTLNDVNNITDVLDHPTNCRSWR